MSDMPDFATASALLASRLGGGPVALLAAGALLEAELLDLSCFGLRFLADHAPYAPIRAEPDGGTVTWRQCAGEFAPLAVAGAALDVASRAQRHGAAVAFLNGVRGFGRLAPFVRAVADHGLVVFAGANAPAFVAPHGGVRAAIGTNPFAFAAGTGDERIVIDTATATTTMAALKQAAADGTPLAGGTGIDSEGHETTVAAAVAALLPRGGQIGSLAGLLVEVLAGIAGGGRGDAGGRGVFFLAFDPARGGDDDFRQRLSGFRREWRDAGGHWPGAAVPAPETPLPEKVVQCLHAALARLEEADPQIP